MLDRPQCLIEPAVHRRDEEFYRWNMTAVVKNKPLRIAQYFEKGFGLSLQASILVIAALHDQLWALDVWGKVYRIDIGSCRAALSISLSDWSRSN